MTYNRNGNEYDGVHEELDAGEEQGEVRRNVGGEVRRRRQEV